MGLTIAIDGPVGAGKSKMAGSLAKALGILHLDTGAMYRALAVKALREGIDPKDAEASEAMSARTKVTVTLDKSGQRTFLDGEDVTDRLRDGDVSDAASAISVHGGVRAQMVTLQQACAAQGDIVLDGRDIGTRVLPDATFKFFLTAKDTVRAMRRHLQNQEKCIVSDYDKVLADLRERDARDATREIDPLVQAEDALLVDTTDMDEPQVLAFLLSRIRG